MILAPGLSWTSGDAAFRFRAPGSTGLSTWWSGARAGSRNPRGDRARWRVQKPSCFLLASDEGLNGAATQKGPPAAIDLKPSDPPEPPLPPRPPLPN